MINKLFNEPPRDTLIQLFRYFFVGGTALVVDFGLLWGLTEWCRLYYLLAATISFIAGLMVNYALSIWWVFREHSLRSRIVEFAAFAIIGLIGLGLNELIIWLATERLRSHYILSKIISATVVFFWNFLARKYLLFYGEKQK